MQDLYQQQWMNQNCIGEIYQGNGFIKANENRIWKDENFASLHQLISCNVTVLQTSKTNKFAAKSLSSSHSLSLSSHKLPKWPITNRYGMRLMHRSAQGIMYNTHCTCLKIQVKSYHKKNCLHQYIKRNKT